MQTRHNILTYSTFTSRDMSGQLTVQGTPDQQQGWCSGISLLVYYIYVQLLHRLLVRWIYISRFWIFFWNNIILIDHHLPLGLVFGCHRPSICPFSNLKCAVQAFSIHSPSKTLNPLIRHSPLTQAITEHEMEYFRSYKTGRRSPKSKQDPIGGGRIICPALLAWSYQMQSSR